MSVHARLGAYYFAFFAQAGAFVSYFALYLEHLGLAAAEIAFAIAMPQVARVVAPTFWGWLADTRGVRRYIVVFSAFAALTGFLALLGQTRAPAIALILLAMSLASAGASPLVEAITLSSIEGQPGRYGTIRLWGSIGFIVAVLGTGAMLDRHDVSVLAALLVALSGLVCAAALALPPADMPRVVHAEGRFGAVLLKPDVLAFLAACFCMTVAHGALYVFYTIYLEAAGYSRTLIGLLWTLGVIAEIVLFLRLQPVMRRISLRALLLASFACAVLRFPLIGWGIDSPLVLAFAQLLHAATFGAFHVSAVAAVHRLFPGTLQARGQAAFSSITYGLGGAAGSLLAGWSWGALGPEPSFAISAGFALLGGLLIAWRFRL